MRFATRMLLLQLATVVAVVGICSAVFAVLAVGQLRAEAEASALSIARTLAEDPDVRTLVTRYSADAGTPDAAPLRGGTLQSLALDVAERTGALFVVITDDHGIRLAHPDPDRLGEEVSTSYAEALAGREVVTWESGTLGESARAKVPVRESDGTRPVGEVSVGFERASVFDDLPAVLGGIAVAAAAALALATLASLLLRRRWERLTLGLQPEELVGLVQNQAAVLDGVGDGVLALDHSGIVRVCNSTAARLLGIAEAVGRSFDDLGLTPDLIDAVRSGDARRGIVRGDRVLYIDVKPVVHGARALGDIVIVRDRTDVEALAERLQTVRAMTDALRVQRHEFANRMHVAAGLLDADRVPDARAFLAELLDRGPIDFAVAGIDRVPDPFVVSLIGAKALAARERGVELRVSDESLILGEVAAVEDVAAVLGNLIDNAIVAAARAQDPTPRWVEVGLFGDADALVLTVADSGAGIDPTADPFSRRQDADTPAVVTDDVHGHGFGLPLSRELARRRGGDVWVIDPGGSASGDRASDSDGAVFGARLPGVLRTTRTERDE